MRLRWAPSRWRDPRPQDARIELIVLHAIAIPHPAWNEEAIEAFLRGAPHEAIPQALARVRASAHFLIRRNGEIVQLVPIRERAWHAGRSAWQGRSQCNDFSIGIELVGHIHTPFTGAQYRAAAMLCKRLIEALALSPDRIVGHADIAPGRKWDPGPCWDWARFQRLVSALAPLAAEFR